LCRSGARRTHTPSRSNIRSVWSSLACEIKAKLTTSNAASSHSASGQLVARERGRFHSSVWISFSSHFSRSLGEGRTKISRCCSGSLGILRVVIGDLLRRQTRLRRRSQELLCQRNDCACNALAESLTASLGFFRSTLRAELLHVTKRSTSALLLARAELGELSRILSLDVCTLLHGGTLKPRLLLGGATVRLRLQVLECPSTGVCEACLALSRPALCNGLKGRFGALQSSALFLLRIRDAEETTERLGHEGSGDAETSADESTRESSHGPTAGSALNSSLRSALCIKLALAQKTEKLV
jgi:hypothetical protein